MNDELEQAAQTAAEHGAAAAAAAGGGAARARPSRCAALSPDTPEGACANCAAELQGPVCHQCGQLADEYHRPVRGLLGELIEGLVALDGRVARTIPNLLLRPGRVTRAYLKGARARFMPPFRLYIIASLIFFLLMPALDRAIDTDGIETDIRTGMIEYELDAAVAAGELTEDEAESARSALDQIGLGPGTQPAPADTRRTGPVAEGSDALLPPPIVIGRQPGDNIATPEAIRRFFAPEDFGEPAAGSALPLALRRHMGERFAEVQADPRGWLERVSQWVPRIMFVMVPVYALLLALAYAWRRNFFLYDHMLVSLHFHSALFLAGAGLMAMSGFVGGVLAWLAGLTYANAYLYRLHRVVYARGRFSSVIRTIALDSLYFFVLMIGLFAVLLLGALA